jgi:hypothetical protein
MRAKSPSILPVEVGKWESFASSGAGELQPNIRLQDIKQIFIGCRVSAEWAAFTRIRLVDVRCEPCWLPR